MASPYSRKPLYHFANETTVGIDKVPLKRAILCESFNGEPAIFAYDNNTGITATSTIQNAFDNANLVKAGGLSITEDIIPPATTDNIALGYKIGDLWLDTVKNDTYMFVDETASVATWKSITPIESMKYDIIATGGQTTFSVVYRPEDVEVYLNGRILPISDYTATNGTDIILNTGATLNDDIKIISKGLSPVADTYSQAVIDSKLSLKLDKANRERLETNFVATAGQTTFNVTYTPGDTVNVFMNGFKLESSDFTATTGTNVVLTLPAVLNDNINIITF